MASDSCVSFDFSDILSKIDEIPISKNKNSHTNGFLKPVDYSFDLDSLCSYNITLSFKNDCSGDNLALLLNDSHESKNHESSGLISLASLAKDHFSNSLSSSLTSNSGESFEDSFLLSLKQDCSEESKSKDCLQDILFERNSEEHDKNANLADVLNFLDLKSSTDVNVENGAPKEKCVPNEEVLDNELIQDIDLSFCLKKSEDKAEFLPGSISLDSKDSGFSDHNSSLYQRSSRSYDENITSENLKRNDQIKFTLNRVKQSLLSRSIAAKPQIDKLRRKKLNMIKSELLKKNISIPFSEEEREQKRKKFLSAIDQSNQCVITSNFLTIPALK